MGLPHADVNIGTRMQVGCPVCLSGGQLEDAHPPPSALFCHVHKLPSASHFHTCGAKLMIAVDANAWLKNARNSARNSARLSELMAT
jgi:hypothetical protein